MGGSETTSSCLEWARKISEHREYGIVVSVAVFIVLCLQGQWKARSTWYLAIVFPPVVLNFLVLIAIACYDFMIGAVMLLAGLIVFWINPSAVIFPIVAIVQISDLVSGRRYELTGYSILFLVILALLYAWIFFFGRIIGSIMH